MEMTPLLRGGGGGRGDGDGERMTLEEGRGRHRAEMKGIHRDCAVYLLIPPGDRGSKVANDLIDVKSLRCQTAKRYIREMRHWTPYVLRSIKVQSYFTASQAARLNRDRTDSLRMHRSLTPALAR